MDTENSPSSEISLIDEAVARLRTVVPATWKVERSNRTFVTSDSRPKVLDGAIDIEAQNFRATLIVEAKRSFSPRDVERAFVDPSIVQQLRAMNATVPILVVSDWLSPRTRELLTDQEINYLDLTGNALIRIENPQIFVRTEGSVRAPRTANPGQVRLRGPRAARVLRLLLDVRPPYGVREIATATGVAVSYVSRLLEALDSEALVERSGRGQIDAVDIPRLLRRWADSYNLLKTNDASTFVATKGAAATFDQLRNRAQADQLAVTGSFAAVRFAPISAPTLLVIYAPNPEAFARSLDLLPADQGANIVVLRPYDPVVWDRASVTDGIRYAAVSQVAVDCLTGNGRMPAEGEALMSWMESNEDIWRLHSLAEIAGPPSW